MLTRIIPHHPASSCDIGAGNPTVRRAHESSENPGTARVVRGMNGLVDLCQIQANDANFVWMFSLLVLTPAFWHS
jgi:hypothetical protein